MDLELVFRWIFGLVLLTSIVISSYYRRRARQATGTIPRTAEGPLAVALRLALSLPALGIIVAYLVAPDWLAWARLEIPEGIRVAAAIVAVGCPLLVYWVFTSIGSNISETVLLKATHQLVMHGPYRWVRHPLYAVALLMLLAISVMAANGLLLAVWVVGVTSFRLVVIPREEANLIARFGADYEQYRTRTGALLPWPGM